MITGDFPSEVSSALGVIPMHVPLSTNPNPHLVSCEPMMRDPEEISQQKKGIYDPRKGMRLRKALESVFNSQLVCLIVYEIYSSSPEVVV